QQHPPHEIEGEKVVKPSVGGYCGSPYPHVDSSSYELHGPDNVEFIDGRKPY
ncbi:hypothetical protein PPTG_25003, partial [Phytophthora nicotianae INRA-310]